MLHFLRIETKSILKMLNLHGIQYFKKSKLREYKVSYLDNTYDFVSPDDFDCVDVIILEQL